MLDLLPLSRAMGTPENVGDVSGKERKKKAKERGRSETLLDSSFILNREKPLFLIISGISKMKHRTEYIVVQNLRIALEKESCYLSLAAHGALYSIGAVGLRGQER